MTRKYGLTPIPYDRLVSWAFGNFIFHNTISSIIKARRAGFSDCIDTEDMFAGFIAELRRNRLTPPGS
jgi:hypothetical protein